MKIIISHDVDHLRMGEHLKDTFLGGSILRTAKGLLKSSISFSQAMKRFSLELNRVKELHEFNAQYGVRETFFFGMRKGLNLSYEYNDAFPLIKYLLDNDVLVGLHGMGYNSIELLKEERDRIASVLPVNYPLGIRNHYLRKDANTLSIMDKLGFVFDSTDYHLVAPHKVGNMWEIPISVMDAGFISHYKNDMDLLKQQTAAKLNEAMQLSLPFFVINFHDAYFNEGYPDFHKWYTWLVPYLKERDFRFINFSEAIKELNADLIHK